MKPRELTAWTFAAVAIVAAAALAIHDHASAARVARSVEAAAAATDRKATDAIARLADVAAQLQAADASKSLSAELEAKLIAELNDCRDEERRAAAQLATGAKALDDATRIIEKMSRQQEAKKSP